MIFVCLGTQIFQMNRVLIEIDRLIETGFINEEVFAQIGKSTYLPRRFKYEAFLSPDDYDEIVKNSDLIISHGGTGAIIKGLKAHKQIIAIPRLKKYGEHEDDHQLEIVNFFSENGFVKAINDINELSNAISGIKSSPIEKQFQGSGNIIEIIDSFISDSFNNV